MEAYAEISFNNDDDPATYFAAAAAAAAANYASLQQFDLDLQQQAQATMPQGTWQDFDMFLPQLDCPSVFYGNSPVTPPSFSTDSSSPQQPQQTAAAASTTLPGYNTTNDAFVDNAIFTQSLLLNNNNDNTKLASMPITPPVVSFDTPVVPSQQQQQQQQQQQPWPDRHQTDTTTTTAAAAAVKTEYPSPENAPLDSIAEEAKAALIDPLASPADEVKHFGPTDISSILQQQQWNSLEGKVPIQRLKPPMMPATATATAVAPQFPCTTTTGRQQKKTAHNAIERRYRNNINDRITELKNAVPALLHARVKDSRTGKRRSVAVDDDDEEGEDGEEYLDGVAVATKLNKATILRKATEYITHLKRSGDDMRRENMLLQQLLSQLPGGEQVLDRYRAQKMQREQEMHQLRVQERQEQLARQQQQRRNRKRTRIQEDYDSSSASDPATPPSSMGNRVFMAIFACLTFFSSSPMTSGTDQQQASSHHHMARTINEHSANMTSGPRAGYSTFLPFSMGWETLRTVIFILFLAQLLLPYVRGWLHPFSFNVRRVSRTKRLATRKRSTLRKSTSTFVATSAMTLGDQKCQRIYDILVKALEGDDDHLPRSTLQYATQIVKEASCLLSRHAFGYEIQYNTGDQLEKDAWEQACRWVKLNEIECLGGNPEVTWWSMLHACLRSVNLVEVLEDKEEELCAMRARVYATAAMQFVVLLRHLPFSERLTQYFLELAVYEAYMDSTNEPYLSALVNTNDDADPVDTILTSQAWREVTHVISDQTGVTNHNSISSSLSLSLTAPVVVPVALLSTLHLLDHLHRQFVWLINGFAQPLRQQQQESSSKNNNNISQEMHLSVLASLGEDDQQLQLVSWLSGVGMAVEVLWRGDVRAAEELLEKMAKRVPRTMTSVVGVHDHGSTKARLSKVDEYTKSSMMQTMVGATLIQSGKTAEGVEQLEKAESLRAMVKKLRTKKEASVRTLESSMMGLAEFAVAVVGLAAWLGAWKSRPELSDKVRLAVLDVRRMEGLKHHKGDLIDRLSNMGRYISGELDDDLISDLNSQDDDDAASLTLPQVSSVHDEEEWVQKRADRALDILHGVL